MSPKGPLRFSLLVCCFLALDASLASPQENKAETHLDRGIALVKTGNLDGAIAEFREALRLQPDYPDAHTSLGVVLEQDL